MALVVTGRLNKQIASELGTSEKTVKAQRGQVMARCGAVDCRPGPMADRLAISKSSNVKVRVMGHGP